MSNWLGKILARQSTGPPVGFFASTTGSATGAGSLADPWTLTVALSGGFPGGTLQPGDTCWVRDGSYSTSGNFDVTSSGSSGNPIVYRSYPGELASILSTSRGPNADAVIFGGAGGHDRRYQDLEVYVSDTDRTSAGERRAGIYLGLRDDAVNCIVHDCGQGIVSFPDAPNMIYGCLDYYNGSDNDWDTRSHNLYLHNAGASVKTIRHNVFFRGSGFNIQAFASGTPANSQVNNLHFEQNVSYDAGILDTSLGTTRNPNYFLGVGDPGVARTVGNIFDGNVNYNASTTGSGGGPSADYGACEYNDQLIQNGYQIRGGSGFNDILAASFENNFVFVDTGTSNAPLVVATTLTTFSALDNNTYRADASLTTPFAWHGANVSFATWKTDTGLDAASTFTTGKPSTPTVFVWPNEHQSGRGMITIMNWPLDATVDVDFSSILSVGDTYQVRDVNNYFGTLIASGTYGGGDVTLTMGGHSCAAPIGYSAPSHLGPEWNCFILEKT